MKIWRDPFARHEIHREAVRCSVVSSCTWCGSQGLRYKSSLGPGVVNHRLWRFKVVRDDSGRESEIGGLFCSPGCLESYHDTRLPR